MNEGENKYVESGIEELRQLAGISRDTREYAFDGFTVLECVNLLRAVRACDWDIYADALTEEERQYAATSGKLSAECVARLDIEFGDGGGGEGEDDETCGSCGASLLPIAGSLWHKPEEDCRAIREPSEEEVRAYEASLDAEGGA
jgi:hypothetical protein